MLNFKFILDEILYQAKCTIRLQLKNKTAHSDLPALARFHEIHHIFLREAKDDEGYEEENLPAYKISSSSLLETAASLP